MEGPRFFWSPRGARATRVVLIGLSGSGKSTVAPLLAQRLRRSCVDLDREIERRAGRSVALLFEEGEGTFRELESRALQDSLEGTRSLVLACGAGVLERSENRELLTTRAKVVWLAVDPETAASRLSGPGAAERPLLHGAGSLVERLRTHLEARRAGYAAAAHTIVDTSGLTPQEVADRIAERLAVA